MSHTPLPWKIKADDYSDNRTIVGPNGEVVLAVHWEPYNDGTNCEWFTDEDEALVLSMSEKIDVLLAACKATLKELEECENVLRDCVGFKESPLGAQLRAAIERAES